MFMEDAVLFRRYRVGFLLVHLSLPEKLPRIVGWHSVSCGLKIRFPEINVVTVVKKQWAAEEVSPAE